MSNRRQGLGLLGLLAVTALGVTALSAASAQALTPQFLINKKAGGTLKATITVKQVGISKILIPALNIEINCTGFTVIEGFTNSSTDANVKLLHEGCTILVSSTKEEAAGCEIVTSHEGGTAKHHITSSGLILPTELKSGEPAVLVEKIVATVLLKKETECVLPVTTTIKGEICSKIDNNDTVEPKLLSSATIQSECKERKTLEALGEEVGEKGIKDKLLFGAQEATIDDTSELALTGEHKGLTFGVSLQ